MVNLLKWFIVGFFSIASSLSHSAQYKFEILESKYLDYSENWVQGSFIFDTTSLSFSSVNLQFSSDPMFDPGTFGYGLNIDQLQVDSLNPVKASFGYAYEAIGGSGKYFVYDDAFLLELPASIQQSAQATLLWTVDISRQIYGGFTCNLVTDGDSTTCEPPYGPDGNLLENRQFSISNQAMTARITAVPEPGNLALLLTGLAFTSLALSHRRQA